MFTIEEVQELLDEAALRLPQGIFDGLTGGVVLSEEEVYHPDDLNHDLLIMGQYQVDSFGARIMIYYGSLMKVYGNESRGFLYQEVEKLLHHELRHHIERLAGVNDLAEEDAVFLEGYRKGHHE
ncbi:MAG: metallopeptidase family protein [Peptoniphilus sp. oral taxon 375]|uniref:metallopeptidase family protein n=1 Tax=Urinicoccus timonensis TaxID=2024205 RepID=UPI00021A2BCF|nr:metallopeptidase family protein [Urinicoccus timonensis]EGS31690.1 hypothetical protein HMPREF9130_1347 [Peptoniphilus sp. oral taxon 375 str. F0436]MBS4872408.1 metallopeptidase family protein [Peptoniphilus sp. oral taxon 375]